MEGVRAWLGDAGASLQRLFGTLASSGDNLTVPLVLGFVGVWLLLAAVLGARIVLRRRRGARSPDQATAQNPAKGQGTPGISVPETKNIAVPEAIVTPAVEEAVPAAGTLRFADFSQIRPRAADPVPFPARLTAPALARASNGKAAVSSTATATREATVRAPDESSAPTESELERPRTAQRTIDESPASGTSTGDLPANRAVEPSTRVGRRPDAEAQEMQSQSTAREVPLLLGRPADEEAQERAYNRLRSSFEMFVRELVHTDVSPFRCVHVGLGNHPVVSTYPNVVWKQPESFYDEDLHNRTEAILGELAFAALRCPQFRPTSSLRDREVAMAVFHHCLWQGRMEAMASLVFRLEEQGELFPELRDLAVTVFAVLGEARFAATLEREELEGSAYLAACRLLARDKRPIEAALNQLVRRSSGVRETRWIAWLRSAASADRTLEARAIQGLAGEVEGEAPLELIAALTTRGHLYRAVRMLYRLQRSVHTVGRLILELYFRNGKFHAYLRALQAVGPVRGPRTYYEAACCLALSRLDVKPQEALRQFQRQGWIPEFPPESERVRFERHLDAVDTGRYRPAALPARFSELVALLYYYARQADHLQSVENQREYVRNLVRVFRNTLRSPEDLFRHELVLPFLAWGFLYSGEQRLDARLLPFLESQAGRSQAVRVLLGFLERNAGDSEGALAYLERSGQHPFVLHRMLELRQETGDIVGAVRIANRLVRLYPGEAVFRHNLAVLLELAGRRYEAELSYGRAVDLQSDLRVSQERLSRLLASRTVGRPV